MNAKKTKLMLYLPTTALGLVCMLLQKQILIHGYDEKGLLIARNPAFWILWVLSLGFLSAVVWLLPKLGDAGTYRMNFPACMLSGGIMMAAGVLMALHGLSMLIWGGERLLALGGVVAGGAMGICGLFRLRGAHPLFWFDSAVCLYLIGQLMTNYRIWNADPQLQKYAFELLAEVSVMLFALHRARCAGGMMDRKRMVFWGFAGIFLCLVALADGQDPLFYLAGGLWCAGGMCELKRFKKRKKSPEPAPEEAAEAPEEIVEEVQVILPENPSESAEA